GLFTLDCAGIACEKPQIAELAAVGLIDLHERTRYSETKRTGLAGESAALNAGHDIEASQSIGCCERLLNRRDVRGTREIVAECATVDLPLSRAWLQVKTADRFLAASDCVRGGTVSHYFSLFLLRSSTFGCCAACECLSFAKTRSLRRSDCLPRAVCGSMPESAFSITRSGCFSIICAKGVNLSWPM